MGQDFLYIQYLKRRCIVVLVHGDPGNAGPLLISVVLVALVGPACNLHIEAKSKSVSYHLEPEAIAIRVY